MKTLRVILLNNEQKKAIFILLDKEKIERGPNCDERKRFGSELKDDS